LRAPVTASAGCSAIALRNGVAPPPHAASAAASATLAIV
jgi:hypothetical protein